MAAITLADPKKQNTIIGASETDLVLSEFSIMSGSALNFRADVVVSGVTVGGGITVKLQNRAKGGSYVDLGSANASSSVTANGTVSINMTVNRAADQVDMPLRKQCQLVITTGAGSAVTINDLTILELK